MRLRKDIGTANHDPRADLEAEMDVYEKLRLLYVACTRARDHLVVAVHHKTGDGSYADTVWTTAQAQPDSWRSLPAEDEDGQAAPPVAPLAAESFTTAGVTATAGESAERPATAGAMAAVSVDDDREAWIAAREALLAPQRRPRFVSATTIAREAGVDPADEGPDLDDAEEGPGGLTGAADLPVAPRRRGRAGTAIGRAVHATLQFVDLAALVGLEAQAAHQADLEAVPEHADLVAAMARSALSSEAVQLAVKSVSHREIYVGAPVGDRVIEGYIELLVETPDGLVIVDYKTDTVASEADVDAKLAAYELQGAAYAVALEVSTGLPVVDCHFVFCRPSGAIERRVADLAAAKDRVRAPARAVGCPAGPVVSGRQPDGIPDGAGVGHSDVAGPGEVGRFDDGKGGSLAGVSDEELIAGGGPGER